ncbi:rhomboid family intramembrane serine protease [Halovenus aranensis]|uniref:rhomboid family intramembrane serine protease n=1 Tax=Halovenus aranensis TaxID=890420 RepID=UPI000B82F089|nr:rhomboid family intramembrane serine protease [Halovenus aranensis]
MSAYPALLSSEAVTLIEQASLALLVGALVLSYLVIYRVGERQSPFVRLRKRFVVGVPWGTVLAVACVYVVYHVVQGAGNPGGPNVIGFRSWSLWYPESIVFAWLSHASSSHLTGNVLATLVFGSIAEYAWSHYPTVTGQHSFSSLRTNPFARIAMFIVGLSLVGIAGSLFVPGAIIGFSGVVFALAGFAIVTRPLVTVGGILGLDGLDLVYSGFQSPVGFAEARPEFTFPYWADTALQGHLFGLVLGVLLAVWVVRRRSRSPNVGHVWFAALVFAVTRSMWTIFWFLSDTEFVLFRGLGAASVAVLASVIAVASLSDGRPLLQDRIEIQARTVGVVILVGIAVLVALAGVPYNLADVSPGEEASDGIEIDGYTVTYAENVEDQYTALDLPVVGDALSVETSGVIVTSDERNVWSLETPRDELALNGFSVVVVGDTTWREVVLVNHTQWQLAGGNTTYKVYGQHWGEMDDQRLLFSAPLGEGQPTINGQRFGIVPSKRFYDIAVLDANGTRKQVRVPAHNESVELGGVTFTRTDNTLVARHNRTELLFAEYRTEREQ